MPASDTELVAQAMAAKPGDLRAFDELVRRHQVRVQTNCRFLSGNEEDSLDLSQEVLVKAYFNLKRFEARSSFGTWLNRIKVNHCLNHLRRNKDKTFVDVQEPGLEAHTAMHSRFDADQGAAAHDERRTIGRVLDDLPENLRVPLILCDMDGLSYQDIADEMGLGLSAVKMRIKRAREEFREAYNREQTSERRYRTSG
jgi:RNA polymerase sigma-70 factor, ECF subfamily